MSGSIAPLLELYKVRSPSELALIGLQIDLQCAQRSGSCASVLSIGVADLTDEIFLFIQVNRFSS